MLVETVRVTELGGETFINLEEMVVQRRGGVALGMSEKMLVIIYMEIQGSATR